MGAIEIGIFDFLNKFPQADQIGNYFAQDLTEDQNVCFYVNEAGEVGEIREDRRTTTSKYNLLQGQDAEMVVSYYTAKKERAARDKPILDQIRALYNQLSDDGRAALKVGN